MKKKIFTAVLLTFIGFSCFTGCNNMVDEENTIKSVQTSEDWEINTYYMNGFYNLDSNELITVDAAGNADLWVDIKILDLYKEAEYWQSISKENEIFVWVKISTNNTKTISDDVAVVFPGNDSVYRDHPKVYSIDGNIVINEE